MLEQELFMRSMTIPTLSGHNYRIMVRMEPRQSQTVGVWKKQLPRVILESLIQVFPNMALPIPIFISPSTSGSTSCQIKRPTRAQACIKGLYPGGY